MLKGSSLTRAQSLRQITAISVILIVAVVGTVILTGSHAATPYVSSSATSGTLASGATARTCTGANSGSCVVFGGSTGGTGGIAYGSVLNSACTPAWGSFGGGNFPPGCWQLYSPTISPFNRPISANPTVMANSAAMIAGLQTFAQDDPNNTPSQFIAAPQGATSGFGTSGFPTYYSAATDPVFTISCNSATLCPIKGQQLHIPQNALAAGNSDGHLTVIDQSTGTEYDFWQAKTPLPQGGGTLVVSGAGKTSVDGDGLGSKAIAANYGSLAGVIRAQELQAGQINHALVMVVHCDNATHVYPATADDQSCSSVGMSNASALPMGARVQLNMTDSQIAALSSPAWQKTILRALAHYGAYVSDTGGDWGFQIDGSQQYNSMGYPNPWLAFAKANGWTLNSSDGTYLGNLTKAVDWYSNLRVLDTCSAQGSC
jgi:hypothetical protein